jgi:hypothetical protein
MTLIALFISLFIAATGAWGLVFPKKLLAFARYFEHPASLWVAGAFRVLFGLALFLAAPTSNAPYILRTLGVIIIVAGFITPFIGIKRVHKLLNWWESRGPFYIRIWAGTALIIGLLLASAVVT